MRLGVIDIGSNTVHVLVVDAHHGARPLPAFSHKIDLRLAEHLVDEAVTEDGIARLVDFTATARHLADEQGVEELLIFATSAVREASNGAAVLARVATSAGGPVGVLSGTDEARLTFLAARRWCGWSAGRVTRELLPGDPPTAAAVKDARRVIRARLAAGIRPLVRAGQADRVVATSKTFRSLARLAGAAPSSEGPYAARVLTRADLTELVARLTPMTAVARAALPGVSLARSAQALGGALVAEATLDLLKVDQVEICPWALREGVILRRLESLD